MIRVGCMWLVVGALWLGVSACGSSADGVVAVPVVQTDAEPASPKVQPPLRFRDLETQVGDVIEKRQETQTQVSVSSGKQSYKSNTVEEQHRTIRVTRVENGIAVRATVHFSRHREEPKPPEISLEGRDFRIERTAAGLVVTDAEGGPLTAKVEAVVQGELKRFGKRRLLELPRTPLHEGDRAKSIELALRRGFASRGEISDVTVRLAEIRDSVDGRVGVFVARFSALFPKRNITSDMRGELHIRERDGRVISTVLTGELEVDGKVSGTGTVRMVSEYSYRSSDL